MVTAASVGKWLFDIILADKYVFQENLVRDIKAQFGDTFVYINDNGNLAISKDVLQEFNKLKTKLGDRGVITWDRSDRAWRYKDSSEN